jgi:cbb3-type cytochrome oxidase subunit 1
MLVGLILAFMFLFQILPMGFVVEFGRLRPLHTNAIFAFVGDSMFAVIYFHAALLKARMFSDFKQPAFLAINYCCGSYFFTIRIQHI